ncbi:tRNA epoxyqueuosine(34) reductase QueG [Hyphomonas sp. FCG-A18]|uniref:tRNA epoxyqueuosine(34) reductase QueG n=1 Tax=Hyphomonas sp. FCG-A18 TaxID=3080019 RepID=UPI002B2A5C69|nr:tRNA epoxyqueuosine(34) reductase QueG [Hyphomonas sp. FCG-A18]
MEDFVKTTALDLGFDACRICRADEPWQAGERLVAFVEAGRHGSMEWMETTLERRKAPTSMWAEAKSAVVVGLNYGPDHDPMTMLARTDEGNISVYARGKDYHDLLKKRLKALARAFVTQTQAQVKVFVDTAPLMEKPLAAKAGVGWQGKHTNLVSRDLGSWLFLGVMLTDAELEADAPEIDHCGSCRACLDVCPTKAFPAPYQLDAKRCISYLTIEHKAPIPHEFREAMGNRIYGCDDCLAVCPWNKFAEVASESAFWARAELKGPGLDELSALDDAAFRELFSGSPIKRIGRDRFLRNVLIAIGNSANHGLIEQSVIPHLADPNPVVRGAAIWALSRLDSACFDVEKAARLDHETDEDVQAEWQSKPGA